MNNTPICFYCEESEAAGWFHPFASASAVDGQFEIVATFTDQPIDGSQPCCEACASGFKKQAEELFGQGG